MSIFSRLFKGPEEADKQPSQEDTASNEAKPRERARKTSSGPGHVAKGKGSMRPLAPSFQINSQVSDGQPPVAAAPIVQVGGPDSKPGASAGVGHRAAGPATEKRSPGHSVRGESGEKQAKPGWATVRLGSQPVPPAPPPQSQASSPKPASVAQRSAGPSLPLGAAGRASPPAVPGTPARGDRSRSKLAASAKANGPKAPSTFASRRDEVATDDGPLTLELGPSSDPALATSSPSKRGATTAQGLAPAAETAQEAAARGAADPEVFSRFDNETNLQSDVDAAFGAMVEAPNGAPKRPAPPGPPPSGASVSELRELFASLAANHMRQVREFMIGVKWGEAPRDWIPICAPAVGSLLRAAKKMDLDDLSIALDAYGEALGRAAAASGATIDEDMRAALMNAYTKLIGLMPDAFALDGERGRRETIIVHALLQQVPEVRKVTIDKIYAAGLTNLDHLFAARPDEISATTGIGENLASRIVERFQSYRREIASLADATRAAERKRLTELALELRGLHHEFERAASGWSDGERAEKKKYRQARAEALLQVRVLLARLGEIDRLGHIDRLPFGRKIDKLEEFLLDAKASEASIR